MREISGRDCGPDTRCGWTSEERVLSYSVGRLMKCRSASQRRTALSKSSPRTKAVTIEQATQYLSKTAEFLASAYVDLTQGRKIAATSSTVHAGINAGDVVSAVRSGRRSAGDAHDRAVDLLRMSGPVGLRWPEATRSARDSQTEG